MKLDGRGFQTLLTAHQRTAAVLLHGDDAGLVHSRATALVRAVAGQLDDPFSVTEVGADQVRRNPSTLAESAAMLPMGGGRTVVRVRDAGDAMTAAAEAVLTARVPGLLVMEAGSLTGRSRLRMAFEKAAAGASVACQPMEPAALAQAIGAGLSELGVAPERDVAALLARLAGPNLLVALGEAQKAALYAGVAGRLTVDDVLACSTDGATGVLDDAVQAALLGDAARADAALERAFAEGATAVGAMRAGIQAFQRLRQGALLMAGGMAAAEAGRALRPPVFFRQEAAFARGLQLWNVEALTRVLREFFTCETACKTTGMPAELLARRTFAACTRMAQRRAQPRVSD